jgi:hypothetical protein
VLADDEAREERHERKAERLREIESLERQKKLEEEKNYESRKSGEEPLEASAREERDRPSSFDVRKAALLAAQAEDDADEEKERDEPLAETELKDIFGIKSSQGEILRFGRALAVRAEGVEQWMRTLEELMISSLSRRIKDAYNKYYEDSDGGRKKWVLEHLSQSVAIVDLVTWTESTEMALADLMDDN